MTTSQYDRAVDCIPCSNHKLTPPYVSYTLQVQPKPLYCPTCQHQRVYRPYSYVDILCTDYAGLSVTTAVKIVLQYNEQRAKGTLSRKSTLDVLDYIRDLGAENMPTLRNFIAPLDISCRECGGSYTLLRNIDSAPNVNKTPPLYCVWCASPSVHVVQQGTEEVWWTSLSLAYNNMPVPMLKIFYDRWTTHSRARTFKEYMNSDMIKSLLEEVA